MLATSAPDIATIRGQFPALASGFAFMDNAGGAQVPLCVADAVRDYMLTSYAQVGGTYEASAAATRTVADAHAMVNTLFGGEGLGHVILGSSTSALFRMLSDCYAEVLGPDDEIVVAESGHEANVHPWTALSKRGVKVKVWEADPETGASRPETLRPLLTDKTRIVAFPQVSNILGVTEQVDEIVRLSHEAGARVVLDSVAYAPHAVLDVAKWGVDFCGFACYKVYGPHMGALWGRQEAWDEITGRNHPFIPKQDLPTKFELGGVSHEGCAGLLALPDYLAFLAGEPGATLERPVVEQAFAVAGELERPLCSRLLEFLRSKPLVRIVGPPEPSPGRFPTIAFLHDRLTPKEIVSHTDRNCIGMRHGNFYSWRLMERLGIPPEQGVARISLVHYNTLDEVDRLIAVLDSIL